MVVADGCKRDAEVAEEVEAHAVLASYRVSGRVSVEEALRSIAVLEAHKEHGVYDNQVRQTVDSMASHWVVVP